MSTVAAGRRKRNARLRQWRQQGRRRLRERQWTDGGAIEVVRFEGDDSCATSRRTAAKNVTARRAAGAAPLLDANARGAAAKNGGDGGAPVRYKEARATLPAPRGSGWRRPASKRRRQRDGGRICCIFPGARESETTQQVRKLFCVPCVFYLQTIAGHCAKSTGQPCYNWLRGRSVFVAVLFDTAQTQKCHSERSR